MLRAGDNIANGSMATAVLTPMMRQYQGIRRSLPDDVLLFFRLGDFYEMFFEDAKRAAGVLNVALTKRNGMPMCGIPYHAAEGYIARLIKARLRVAICEQTSEPQPGKIVEREVTRIVSAGTIDDLNLLEARRYNYLAAVNKEKRSYGLAYLDLTTGDFRLLEARDRATLDDELARISATEILYRDDQGEEFGKIGNGLAYESYPYFLEQAEYALCKHFQVHSLDGFGCAGHPSAVGAAGAILHYLQHAMRRTAPNVRSLRVVHPESFVLLDAATQSNLELLSSRSQASGAATLLSALDDTVTPMGARLLRDWIAHPLRNLAELRARQSFLGGLREEPFILSAVRDSLKQVRDVERTLGRLSQGSGNARDLQALRQSLEQLTDLRAHLEALWQPKGMELLEHAGVPKESLRVRESDGALDENDPCALAYRTHGEIEPLPELVELLNHALAEEAPLSLKDGGIFRDGYNEALDEFRVASRGGKDWIAKLQQDEIERTGIKSLKVRYNNVFGYYIEVTKSNLSLVPHEYTRKQTTVNGERFITPELKQMENKILGADEKARKLEYQLFQDLRERVLTHTVSLQRTAAALARLDVIAGLAEVARQYGYVRPLLFDEPILDIRDGRHPVLDQNLADEKFVPNDTFLDADEARLGIITGPNMAGKSTYIRQVALLVLMAQIGSDIPAKSARIGLVDRIFTRVGANDDLARGQSTFMVEMNETANILNNATAASLVILDEIGRGTSTFDGLSIAWSVAEYLHDVIGARTLFATHYHELTELAATRPTVRNLNVAVREWNDQIIFLRKIIPGAADKSYGIQVARLAGLPEVVVKRARAILDNLERGEYDEKGRPLLAAMDAAPPALPPPPAPAITKSPYAEDLEIDELEEGEDAHFEEVAAPPAPIHRDPQLRKPQPPPAKVPPGQRAKAKAEFRDKKGKKPTLVANNVRRGDGSQPPPKGAKAGRGKPDPAKEKRLEAQLRERLRKKTADPPAPEEMGPAPQMWLFT